MLSASPSASSLAMIRSDAAIKRANHRRIDPQAVRADIAHRLVIRARGLQRRVAPPSADR